MQLRALAELDDAALREVYAAPRAPWFRLNFVSTVDGCATGSDGLSGSINNAPDGRVFSMLRDLADVVVAGAGTVREEQYEPNAKPFVVVSRSGDVPPSLRAGSLDLVHLVTVASASGLAESRSLLGDRVLVLGEDEVDLVAMRSALEALGFDDILCEGGPSLARDLLAAGVVDELCLTTVPRVVAGAGPRITTGGLVDVPLSLHGLLEQEGTLLGRWFTG